MTIIGHCSRFKAAEEKTIDKKGFAFCSIWTFNDKKKEDKFFSLTKINTMSVFSCKAFSSDSVNEHMD